MTLQDIIDERSALWSLLGGVAGYVVGWVRYHRFHRRNERL